MFESRKKGIVNFRDGAFYSIVEANMIGGSWSMTLNYEQVNEDRS